MAAVTLTKEGLPDLVYAAHILTSPESKQLCEIVPPFCAATQGIDFPSLVRALENELSACQKGFDVGSGMVRAVLVSVTSEPRHTAKASIGKLHELLSVTC